MTRLAIAFVLALAAAALAGAGATGCTITTTASDAGTDAATQTVQEQCALIAAALCNAYSSCALQEPDDCVENYNAGCCSGTVCGEASDTSEDALQGCVDAYTMQPDCNGLENSITPDACTGIPQVP
jgi:hypothetical protein